METKHEERQYLESGLEEFSVRDLIPVILTTEKNLVFERSTKSTAMFLDHLLDLSTNAADSSNGRTLKLGHFQRRIEHSLHQQRHD